MVYLILPGLDPQRLAQPPQTLENEYRNRSRGLPQFSRRRQAKMGLFLRPEFSANVFMDIYENPRNACELLRVALQAVSEPVMVIDTVARRIIEDGRRPQSVRPLAWGWLTCRPEKCAVAANSYSEAK